MIALLAAVLLRPQELEPLVRKLADDAPAERDRAAASILERWREWKEPDLEVLKRAAGGPDKESAARAGQLHRRILRRRALGPELVGRFPALDRIVEAGAEGERVAVLVEVRSLWRRAEIGTAPAQALARAMVDHGFAAKGVDDLLEDLPRPFRPLLVPALADPELVLDGITLAEELDARDLVPSLRTAVESGSPTARARAAGVLAAWGQAPPAGPIVAILRAEEPSARAAALETLGRMGAKEAIGEVERLLEDPEASVRREAVGTLRALGARDRTERLARRLEDPDTYVSQAAAEALVEFGAKEHAGALLARMAGTHGYPRRVYQEAVRTLGAEPLKDQILALVRHPREGTPWVAWELYTGLGPDAAAKPLEFLKDPDAGVRAMAVRALTWRRKREDAEVFAGLLKDSDPGVRRAALDGLATLGARERIEDIARLLDDPHPWARTDAATTLARLGARSQADAIARLLRDSDPYVRGTAVDVLAWVGAKAHAAGVRAQLSHESDSLQRAAIRALGLLGDPEDVKLLRPFLKSEDSDVRASAAEALAELDPAGSVKDLRSLAWDGDQGVSHAVFGGLAAAGTDEAAEVIVAHQKGGDRVPKISALLSLSRPDTPSKAIFLYPDRGESERRWLVEALARWTARGITPGDPAQLARFLDRLDEETDESLPPLAAAARVGLGLRPAASLADRLDWIQEDVRFPVLCLAHARESFPRLYVPFTPGREIASTADLAEAAKRDLGIRFEVSPDYVFQGVVREGQRTTLMHLLLHRLLEQEPRQEAYLPTTGLVVEDGVIRAVLEHDARVFWRKRLAGR